MADRALLCGVLIVSLLSVVVCTNEAGTSVTHNITWSSNVSTLYPPSSPLEVKLDDRLNIKCPPGGTSNIWIQTDLRQYEMCDCNAEGVENPDCTNTVRQLCFDEVQLAITLNSKDLASALSFEPGTYYLISYSPGNAVLDGFLPVSEGGECLHGYRMAMNVQPLAVPTTTTPPPMATTTDNKESFTKVPSPMVKIIFSTTDPVLTGSSLRLTCIVEWTMAVPRSVDIQATWTGPNGSSLMSDLVMKTSSRYISEVELDSIDSMHQGEYTCTVNIGNEISLSAKKTLTIGDAMFQMRLKRVGDCQFWTPAKASSFMRQIEDALTTAVESRCKCHFPHSHLLNGSFHCQNSSTHVTYRNTLIRTYNFNGNQILGFIQDWVSSGASVKVDWYSVGIDKHCPVAIASLNERECGYEMCSDPRCHTPPCFDT